MSSSAGSKRRSAEISGSDLPAPLPASVIKRLAKEYGDIIANKHGCDYVSVEPQTPEDLSHWKGWVKGAPGTPYEGGLFRVRLTVSPEYPFKPPGLQLDTKIYHCNIDSSGGVCLNILKSEWSPSQTLISLMQTLYVLLGSPNPEDPLMPAIAAQLRADRAAHDRTAREWTRRFASADALPALSAATAAVSAPTGRGRRSSPAAVAAAGAGVGESLPDDNDTAKAGISAAVAPPPPPLSAADVVRTSSDTGVRARSKRGGDSASGKPPRKELR